MVVIIYFRFHWNPLRRLRATDGVKTWSFALLWLLAFTTACTTIQALINRLFDQFVYIWITWYKEKLMNEENEWDHGISAEVKEDLIASGLMKLLQHWKRWRGINLAPGLSGLTAEMIQATEDTGTQWLLDLCNDIVKEDCIPEDWKSSVILPIQRERWSNGVWIL